MKPTDYDPDFWRVSDLDSGGWGKFLATAATFVIVLIAWLPLVRDVLGRVVIDGSRSAAGTGHPPGLPQGTPWVVLLHLPIHRSRGSE